MRALREVRALLSLEIEAGHQMKMGKRPSVTPPVTGSLLVSAQPTTYKDEQLLSEICMRV